jgi:hypothetical protein
VLRRSRPLRVVPRSIDGSQRTQVDVGRRTAALKPGVPSLRCGYKGRASAIPAQAAEPPVLPVPRRPLSPSPAWFRRQRTTQAPSLRSPELAHAAGVPTASSSSSEQELQRPPPPAAAVLPHRRPYRPVSGHKLSVQKVVPTLTSKKC